MSATFTPNINFLEPTFRRAVKLWWAFAWRAGLLVGSANAMLEIILGPRVLGALFGVSAATVEPYVTISNVIVGSILSIYAIQLVLRKKYREFSICLVPTGPGKSN